MEVGHEYDRFRTLVKPALESKLNEFRMLGYEKITEQELWEFLIKKKWKKMKKEPHLYQIVQEILSVQVNEFMNFATVEAFMMADFDLDDEEARKELLK
ncbi:post-transcriptional regulator [Bacillus methanolicus]|uniref:post-transcriptional regulator n=1 Tax=Bacillus methanolicus TaxID=1471 RepID=UPI0023809FCD|nr:post-transcriptional regulator [Bacillus methanolicus]MDE3839734.1 post-transcriptional regulator [Bacillus methanolicus]